VSMQNYRTVPAIRQIFFPIVCKCAILPEDRAQTGLKKAVVISSRAKARVEEQLPEFAKRYKQIIDVAMPISLERIFRRSCSRSNQSPRSKLSRYEMNVVVAQLAAED